MPQKTEYILGMGNPITKVIRMGSLSEFVMVCFHSIDCGHPLKTFVSRRCKFRCVLKLMLWGGTICLVTQNLWLKATLKQVYEACRWAQRQDYSQIPGYIARMWMSMKNHNCRIVWGLCIETFPSDTLWAIHLQHDCTGSISTARWKEDEDCL